MLFSDHQPLDLPWTVVLLNVRSVDDESLSVRSLFYNFESQSAESLLLAVLAKF